MENDLPSAAIGHVILNVKDVDTSYDFYQKLGLRPWGRFPNAAIVELLGGTHVLLIDKSRPDIEKWPESLVGQMRKHWSEHIDLMIRGRSHEDLAAFREKIVANGIAAGEIKVEEPYGHRVFCVRDPDGHDITIYTSHTDKPV